MSSDPVRLHAVPADVRVSERSRQEIQDEATAELVAQAFEAGRRARETSAAAAFLRASEELARVRTTLEEESSGAAVQLALKISERILRRELAQRGYDLEAIVREVLATADAQRSDCVVRMHPEDVERAGELCLRSGTRVEPDPGLRAGDVQVETPHGLLVRDVDELWTNIEERLLSELE